MGVDGVVVADRVGRLGAQHLAGEDAQLAGQLGLGQPLERAGGDVAHQDPVGRPSTVGGSAEVVARVNTSTSMPRCGEPLGELDDVDVHAAGVAGAGLVERGGVQADHRHAPGSGPHDAFHAISCRGRLG